MKATKLDLKRTLLRAASAALLGLALLSGSEAFALVIHGDFAGSTVTYRNVREATNSAGDPEPLFGAPTIAGDTLDFDPVGFAASSSGGGAPDVTDANLVFEIEANASQIIDKLLLTEAGSYTLVGTGTAATQVQISAPVFIDIEEVDGVGINPLEIQTALVFSPGSIFNLPANGGVGVVWTGMLMVDITGALISNAISFADGATKISVDMSNILVALSELESTASITKNDADGVTVTVLPEPATAHLLLLGLGAVLALRRRG